MNTVTVLFKQGVRGPMSGRQDAKWLSTFTSMLQPQQGVMAAGPQVSCEIMPHLQTHMYIVAVAVVPLLTAYQLAVSAGEQHERANYIEHVEVGMTQFLLHAGYRVASLPAQNRAIDASSSIWTGLCTHAENPNTSCEIVPESSVFVKFGGQMMRSKSFCGLFVRAVTLATQQLIQSRSASVRSWPEQTSYG
jgi:hypothetical protein